MPRTGWLQKKYHFFLSISDNWLWNHTCLYFGLSIWSTNHDPVYSIYALLDSLGLLIGKKTCDLRICMADMVQTLFWGESNFVTKVKTIRAQRAEECERNKYNDDRQNQWWIQELARATQLLWTARQLLATCPHDGPNLAKLSTQTCTGVQTTRSSQILTDNLYFMQKYH